MQAREPLELESQVIQILGTECESSKAVCALHYRTSSPAPAVLHIREAGDDTEHGDFPHTSSIRYFPHYKQGGESHLVSLLYSHEEGNGLWSRPSGEGVVLDYH